MADRRAVALAVGNSSAAFIYEPNPPYNLFTYALPYSVSKVTGLNLGIALFAYIMTLLALSCAMLAYALSAVLKLSQPLLVLAVAAYVLEMTVATTSVYAEREHIIAVVIVPFALLQWGITQNIPLKKGVVWAFFVLGSLIIFMKPHHGLIPALMIFHRIGLISIFADRILRGAPITIFGDGSASRDFVFVDNVVAAIVLAGTRAAVSGRSFNVALGERTTLLELAAAVSEACEATPTIVFAPERLGDVRDSVADISRAREELGYAPTASLRDGLRALVASLRSAQNPRGP